MTTDVFDFSLSTTRSQILAHLGCSCDASIQEMANPGGCSQGIWLLNDVDQKLILKLTSSKRKLPHIPTDAEKCVTLASKHPNIGSDHSLSFPVMVFRCCEPSGDELHDLHVMRHARGLRIADVVAHYCRANHSKLDNLVEIFRNFGAFLAKFHEAYQMQHGDCHPSNVFYDESCNLFTLIDVAGISVSPYTTDDDDFTYFNRALMMLSQYYGSELLTRCGLSMRAGYKEWRCSA